MCFLPMSSIRCGLLCPRLSGLCGGWGTGSASLSKGSPRFRGRTQAQKDFRQKCYNTAEGLIACQGGASVFSCTLLVDLQPERHRHQRERHRKNGGKESQFPVEDSWSEDMVITSVG